MSLLRPARAWAVTLCVAAVVVAFVGSVVTALPAPEARAHDEAGGHERSRGSLRVAVASRIGEPGTLTPLSYWGGFETKTAVFEPLVGVTATGAPAPALAESWDVTPDGRTWTFTLRAGVVAHDGAPLGADAVRDHLLRWRGNPAHRWLPCSELMEKIEAPDATHVRVTLSQPWYLLPELATVNPGHVVAPGSWKPNGDVKASVGTGPFRIVSQVPGERFVLEAHDLWWGGKPGVARLELVAAPTRERESEEGLRMLLRGEVDLVADGETPRIPRDQLAEVRDDPRWRVWTSPGSNVNYLLFNLARPPFSDRAARQRVADGVVRAGLIDAGELGLASPATSMFRAPGAGWPAEGAPPRPGAVVTSPAFEAVLLLPPAPAARFRRHAKALAAQLVTVGITLQTEVAGNSEEYGRRCATADYDLVFGATQGLPYDPWIAARSMFLRDPASVGKHAATSAPVWIDAAMERALRAAFAAADDAGRRAAFVEAQDRLDAELPLLPLFVPHRVAVSRADVHGVTIAENGYDFGLARVKRGGR